MLLQLKLRDRRTGALDDKCSSAIAQPNRGSRLLRRNQISITPTEEIRLVARPARHGARDHLRRRKHVLDLRSIEPAVLENLIGEACDLRPISVAHPLRRLCILTRQRCYVSLAARLRLVIARKHPAGQRPPQRPTHPLHLGADKNSSPTPSGLTHSFNHLVGKCI